MDWYFPPSTLNRLIDMDFEDNTVYFFNRRRYSDGKALRNNSKTKIATTKKFYLSINGYDERYSGGYGEEGKAFVESVYRHGGKIEKLDSYIEDLEYIKTEDYTQLSRDATRNKKIYNEIKNTDPDIFINFSWEYGEETYYNPSKDFSKYSLNNSSDEDIKNYNVRKRNGFYDSFIFSEGNIIIKVPISLIFYKNNENEYPIFHKIDKYDENNTNVFTSTNPIMSFEKYENDHFLITDSDEIRILKSNHMEGVFTTFIKVPKHIGEIWKHRCEKCWDLEKTLQKVRDSGKSLFIGEMLVNQRFDYFDRVFLNWDIGGKYLRWVLDLIDDDDRTFIDIDSRLGYFSFYLSRMNRQVECFNSMKIDCERYFNMLKSIYNLNINFINAAYTNIYFHEKYDVLLDFHSAMTRYSESVIKQIGRQTTKKIIVLWPSDNFSKHFERMKAIGFDKFTKNNECENGKITIGYFHRG